MSVTAIAEDTSTRHRYIIGAVKIAPVHPDGTPARDMVASVLTPEDDRAYQNIIGADDPDPAGGAATAGEVAPVGADVAYMLELTNEEAERLADPANSSNVRYVELDQQDTIDGPVSVEPVDRAMADLGVPDLATLDWMGASIPGWRGDGTLCAVLDGGVSPEVRERLGLRVVAERNFSGVPAGPDGITSDHGCLVAPCALLPGTGLIDVIVCDDAGSSWHSRSTAALRWSVDQAASVGAGALVVNFSSSGRVGSSVWRDVLAYARERETLVFCSAGNSGRELEYPAAYCVDFDNVLASTAYDHRTGALASFSNRGAIASGGAAGVRVLTLNAQGEPVEASGTSFSCPIMVRLVLALLSGGRFSPAQVVEALRATARAAADPTHGVGPWLLSAALERLQATEDPLEPPASIPPETTPEPPPLRDERPGCLVGLRRVFTG